MINYFELIELGERDLRNKAYFSAIEHFRNAKSLFGLETVIGALKKEEISLHNTQAKSFALELYKSLTGETWQ